MDSVDFVPFATSTASNFDRADSSSSIAQITDVRAPWMQFSLSDGVTDSNSSSLVRLHNEILTFCEYAEPTKVSTSKQRDLTSLMIKRFKERATNS
jgi:hypothetical protein